MSILITNHDKSDVNEEINNEKCEFLSMSLENKSKQRPSTPKLRSILRKHVEKKVSINISENSEQTSTLINENDYNNDRDSDYTADDDDDDDDQDQTNINQEKDNQINTSHFSDSDQVLKKSSLTSSIKSFEINNSIRKEKSVTIKDDFSSSSTSDRSPNVTFSSEQPAIIQQSSSVKINIEQHPSVTFLNMNQDQAATTTTALTSDFRPVYVSPLKYRPLLGLSANDSRLLLEKRVSLLGKPLVYHPIQKRSFAYRRTQLRIYNFLERADGYKAIIYHTFVFFTVFFCLFLSVVVTMPEYEKIAITVLLPTEILVFIWLSIELSLRVWSAGCRSRYQTLMGRLRFMKKPFCALDLFVIVSTVLTLCLNIRSGNGVFAASALRGLRFFQILRMLRMDRRGGTWKLLGSVVYAHRQELITTIYIGFLALIFSSFIMFLVEKDVIIENNSTNIITASSIASLIDTDRHKFQTFADALWWGIITLCTVGYGDKVPSSYAGKVIAAVCSFIGISFFALPAGILGSGFALKVQQQQRQKHYKRRKIPAVLLIQNLWRVYAADEKSLSKATWKVHVRPAKPNKNNDTSTSQADGHSTSFKIRNNHSFLNRVSFRRRTPSPSNRNIKSTSSSTINAIRSCVDGHEDSTSITQSPSVSFPHDGSSSDNDEDNIYYANDVKSLTTTHKNAIRFIRKIKYFVARRKFREALRPYDVTDVIEQYSTGNVDMLARMKYLQARLDKVLGTSKSLDSYESGPSLASRICKIERQVDGLDVKVDRLCQLTNNLLEQIRHQQNSITNRSVVRSVVPNRSRRRNHFHIHRRRQHGRSPPDESSSQITQRPTSLLVTDQSRENLMNLYSLFQENLDSSKTDIV